MRSFTYQNAASPEQAIQANAAARTVQQWADVRYVAGGTTLIDLMKLNVETPAKVVDINALGFDKIETQPDGSLRVGALVRNSALAHDATVMRDYPVLSQALLSGASPQLRNMATTSGNLLQRTRCLYFRDTSEPMCNKRNPGSGCAAIHGYNRMHAILGTSEHCIATHPSDMCVALTALEATIHVRSPKGERDIPIGEFYKEPGKSPNIENVLEPGDLITHVTLPRPVGPKQVYLKLRDRAAYEFALASVAVVANVENGRITNSRIALGGVGTVPWRSHAAERALEGKPSSPETFRAAADAALAGAKPQSENGFKVELAKRSIIRGLTMATSQA